MFNSFRASRRPARSRFVLLLLGVFALLTFGTFAASRAGAAPPPPTTMTVLPDIPGVDEVQPFGINNRGQVMGYYLVIDWETFDFSYHGYVYDKGVYTTIEPPAAGPMLSWVNLADINDRGQIVGTAYDMDYNGYSFLYDRGTYTTIDVPGSVPGSTYVSAINERGQIVGTFAGATGGYYGFLYDSGVYNTIVPFGSTFAQAAGINERGQIVGTYVTRINGGGSKAYGFVYDKGVFTTLNHPDVVQSQYTNGTTAGWINDRGQVIGTYADSKFRNRSFLYDNGAYTTIGIPGSSYDYVTGFNSRGQVVGVYGSNYTNHGFLWEKGVLITLDAPGVVDGTLLTGINDGGKVVGMYQVSGDDFFHNYQFILTH